MEKQGDTSKIQGDKMEQTGARKPHKKHEPSMDESGIDNLEIPAPEEHGTEGSEKIHGDKLEHPDSGPEH